MGQVTHLNSTPFLPISIVPHRQATPHNTEITPLCHSSAVPLSPQQRWSPATHPSPQNQPHHSSLLNEKSPPPQTCTFPNRCSCLSPGFPYTENSPLSLIHHLATSPDLYLSWNETFPFVLPNPYIISIFLSSTVFFFSFFQIALPTWIFTLPGSVPQGGLSLPACPSTVILRVWSLNQQCQHHLGMCSKCKVLGPTPRPTESETLGMGPVFRVIPMHAKVYKPLPWDKVYLPSFSSFHSRSLRHASCSHPGTSSQCP